MRNELTEESTILVMKVSLLERRCDLPNVLATSDTIWVKKKLDMIWVNFVKLSKIKGEFQFFFILHSSQPGVPSSCFFFFVFLTIDERSPSKMLLHFRS